MRSLVTTTVFVSIVLLSASAAAQLPELIVEIPSDTTNVIFGERIVPLGDQNDDGFDDILIYRSNYVALLYYGGDPFDTLPDLRFDSTYTPYGLGDINSDGFVDFAAGSRSMWLTRIFYGGPDIDTIPDRIVGELSMLPARPYVWGKDVNSNGSEELIARKIDRPLLGYEMGPGADSLHDFEIPAANRSMGWIIGDGIISADFDGDGTADLAMSVRPGGSAGDSSGYVYMFWGGVELDTIPDIVFSHPGPWIQGEDWFGSQALELLGDVNADGYSDFLASGATNYDDTTSYIYFGGPDIDSVPNVVIPWRLQKARHGGDLNTDGHDDFIVSDYSSWDWWGDVRIHYGGPDVDSIPDVVITNNDMPEFQTEFGRDCSGVGDVNGDGIDDFAFSASLSSFRGAVYIFSGVDQGMGVELEYDPALPEDFSLSQNHPNPFNLSTTIELALPERSRVTLTVYNILGQEVTELVNRSLPSGIHRVRWNGEDDRGRVMPSGVYLYRLRAGEYSQARKMVLVK